MENHIGHHHHRPRHFMVAEMPVKAPKPPMRYPRMLDPRIPTDILHPNYPPFHSNGISWTDEGIYPMQREERYINKRDCGHQACDNSEQPLDWDEVYGPGVPGDEVTHRYNRPKKEEKDELNMQDLTEEQVDNWFDDDDDTAQSHELNPEDFTNGEEEIPDYINNI